MDAGTEGPFLSAGGVGRPGKCSVEEEDCEGLGLGANLKRPFNLAPNWEAEVERDRVPVGENVGEFDRDEEVAIVEYMVWVIPSGILASCWWMKGIRYDEGYSCRYSEGRRKVRRWCECGESGGAFLEIERGGLQLRK